MAVQTWIDFSNGDTLLDIRNKLNSFNASVNTEVDANAAAITANIGSISAVGDRVTVNEADIVSLDGRVTVTEGAVAQNTADIASNAPFVPTYDWAKGVFITVTDDVYETIVSLTTPSRDAGTYKLSQSMMYSLNSTTTSAYFRFSIDGGTTWSEIRREPKDNTDVLPSAYTSTIPHTGGAFEVLIQARKESAGATLIVAQIDVIIERKV